MLKTKGPQPPQLFCYRSRLRHARSDAIQRSRLDQSRDIQPRSAQAKSRRIDEFAEFEVRKELLREITDWRHLEIELSTSLPTNARLDRLLASELGISRSQLSAFLDAGLLKTNPDRSDILGRRIRNGVLVTLDLSDRDDRDLVWKPLAIGEG